jgi:quercetin dioxygenase-like cupin family protein
MLNAIRLFTGPDGGTHIQKGQVSLHSRTDVLSAHFEETAAHGTLAWHTAPEVQFVITLSGTLEFKTRDGETFVLRPGDVLVAEDTTGTGHTWKLIDGHPWRRMYVVLQPGAQNLFLPD